MVENLPCSSGFNTGSIPDLKRFHTPQLGGSNKDPVQPKPNKFKKKLSYQGSPGAIKDYLIAAVTVGVKWYGHFL